MDNKKTHTLLKKWLISNSYSVISDTPPVGGGTGIDIHAKKGNTNYLIELIGYANKGPKRTKDFNQSFIQTISNYDKPSNKLILAVPIDFQKGIKQRLKYWGIAWEKIGKNFSNLELWFVKSAKEVESYKWNEVHKKFK